MRRYGRHLEPLTTSENKKSPGTTAGHPGAIPRAQGGRAREQDSILVGAVAREVAGTSPTSRDRAGCCSDGRLRPPPMGARSRGGHTRPQACRNLRTPAREPEATILRAPPSQPPSSPDSVHSRDPSRDHMACRSLRGCARRRTAGKGASYCATLALENISGGL